MIPNCGPSGRAKVDGVHNNLVGKVGNPALRIAIVGISTTILVFVFLPILVLFVQRRGSEQEAASTLEPLLPWQKRKIAGNKSAMPAEKVDVERPSDEPPTITRGGDSVGRTELHFAHQVSKSYIRLLLRRDELLKLVAKISILVTSRISLSKFRPPPAGNMGRAGGRIGKRGGGKLVVAKHAAESFTGKSTDGMIFYEGVLDSAEEVNILELSNSVTAVKNTLNPTLGDILSRLGKALAESAEMGMVRHGGRKGRDPVGFSPLARQVEKVLRQELLVEDEEYLRYGLLGAPRNEGGGLNVTAAGVEQRNRRGLCDKKLKDLPMSCVLLEPCKTIPPKDLEEHGQCGTTTRRIVVLSEKVTLNESSLPVRLFTSRTSLMISDALNHLERITEGVRLHQNASARLDCIPHRGAAISERGGAAGAVRRMGVVAADVMNCIDYCLDSWWKCSKSCASSIAASIASSSTASCVPG